MKTAIVNLGQILTGDWRDPVAPGDSIVMDGGEIVHVGTASASQVANCDVVIDADASAGGTILPGQPFTASLDGYPAQTGYDEQTGQLYLDYLDENGAPVSRMWLMNAGALSATIRG